MKIVRGSYQTHKEKLLPMLKQHWDEIGLVGTEGLTLKVNEDIYNQAEYCNNYLGLGIEEDGEFIGYFSFFMFMHPHHCDHKFAQTDCFFVRPDKRSFTTGKQVIKLFKVAESILKEEYGCSYIFLTVSVKNKLEALAKHLNFVPSDTVYIKRIK